MTKTILILLAAILMGCGQKPAEEVAPQPAEAPQPKQETAEERRERWAKEDLANNKEEATQATKKFGVSTAPSAFPTLNMTYSWEERLALGLSYLQKEPQIYNEKSFLSGLQLESLKQADGIRGMFQRFKIQLKVAYGLLQQGNNPASFYGDSSSKELREAGAKILQNEMLREQAYSWALPAIKSAFKTMPTTDRTEYLQILRHGQDYLSNFNQKEEEAYLASIENDGCTKIAWQIKQAKGYTCKGLFTSFGANGVENPYRKLETFFFRRAKGRVVRFRDEVSVGPLGHRSFITVLHKDPT